MLHVAGDVCNAACQLDLEFGASSAIATVIVATDCLAQPTLCEKAQTGCIIRSSSRRSARNWRGNMAWTAPWCWLLVCVGAESSAGATDGGPPVHDIDVRRNAFPRTCDGSILLRKDATRISEMQSANPYGFTLWPDSRNNSTKAHDEKVVVMGVVERIEHVIPHEQLSLGSSCLPGDL